MDFYQRDAHADNRAQQSFHRHACRVRGRGTNSHQPLVYRKSSNQSNLCGAEQNRRSQRPRTQASKLQSRPKAHGARSTTPANNIFVYVQTCQDAEDLAELAQPPIYIAGSGPPPEKTKEEGDTGPMDFCSDPPNSLILPPRPLPPKVSITFPTPSWMWDKRLLWSKSRKKSRASRTKTRSSMQSSMLLLAGDTYRSLEATDDPQVGPLSSCQRRLRGKSPLQTACLFHPTTGALPRQSSRAPIALLRMHHSSFSCRTFPSST